MNCRLRRRTRRTERAVLALAAVLAFSVAHAAALYRWNDADGRVVYGDKPPKNALNVTRIEVDTTTTVIPAPPQAQPRPAAGTGLETRPQVPDLLTQRRATRERLEQGIEQAQAKLDLAKKNLAEATDMAPDEQQSVVEKVADLPAGTRAAPSTGIDPGNMPLAKGGMFGMSTNRQNCSKVVGPSGKGGVICPTIIPNQAYRERIAALEDAVKKAQAELDAAKEAYNRGVD